MTTPLKDIVKNALEDVKGERIVEIDVIGVSDVADTLIICSGASNRQVKSLANNVLDEAKKAGFRPIGVEGMESGEWVLVDFGSVVVHAMLPSSREFYELEKLWSRIPPNQIPDHD
ncbi:MAG TPA: ribosome silencing factor [Marinagarivorans sp.]